MIRSRLILLSLTLAVGALWASSAYAQPRYYPTQGPISPWMNMWQRKPGPLDNYHTYVQPEMQLQGVVSQQHKALMRNATGIQTLGEAMEGANRQDQVRATGTGSVFMEYSHYYPMGARGSMGRSRSLSMHRIMPSSGTRYAR
jgi:hypothetical protein